MAGEDLPKSVVQARPLGSLSLSMSWLSSWTWARLAAAAFSAALQVPPLTEPLSEVHDQQVRWTRRDSAWSGVSLEKKKEYLQYLQHF